MSLSSLFLMHVHKVRIQGTLPYILFGEMLLWCSSVVKHGLMSVNGIYITISQGFLSCGFRTHLIYPVP